MHGWIDLLFVPLVHARWTDDGRVRALTRHVTMTGWALPFVMAALVIELGFLPPHRGAERPAS